MTVTVTPIQRNDGDGNAPYGAITVTTAPYMVQ